MMNLHKFYEEIVISELHLPYRSDRDSPTANEGYSVFVALISVGKDYSREQG